MSTDGPSAGWYPNPDGTGGLRWWSGIGWTEYTRPAAPGEPTQVLGEAEPTQVLGEAEPTQVVDHVPPTSAWGQTPAQPPAAQPWGQPAGYYGAYTPPPANPLTASGMRPLGGMFSDIGRITRRAWLPILGISLLIWAAVSAVLGLAAVAFVDIPALRRGFDVLGQALENNPDGTFTDAQVEQLQTDFSDAFNRLPVAGWVLLGIALGVLFMLATTVQTAAVNRLAMDAAGSKPVTWGAGWRSGFTAGFRLFGYYILLMVVATLAVIAVTIIIVVVAQLSPALAAALGILAFFASIAVSFWLTGRLIPTVAQAVVGPRAISWSWRATKGKVWAVLGRYLLWTLAASVIINVVTSIVSVPVSLLFLGETANNSDPFSSMGLALTLNLVLLPFSMAMASISLIGIVPIWRDLTDTEYRSIDDNGVPIPVPASPQA